MQPRIPVLLVAAGLTMAGCAPGVDVSEEEAAVRSVSARWLELSGQGDAAGVAGLFATDGAVYWEDRPPTTGPAAIEAFMTRQYAERSGDAGGFGPDRVDVAASGDLAVEQGSYDEPGDAGRYVTVYRKVDDTWKVATDMSVSTRPNGGAPTWAVEHLARWYETYNARDVQALADLYTRTARVGDAQGRAAIIRRYQAGWAEDNDTCSGAYDDFMVVGPIAAGWGRDVCVTAPSDGGSATTVHSAWLVVFERQADGSWLLIRDNGEEIGS